MPRPFLLIMLIAVLLAGCQPSERSAAPATATTNAAANPASVTPPPEALVRTLYEQHAAQQSPFFQTASRERVDLYFEKALSERIWADAVAANGEVGALGFDPLFAAQDTDIKNFVIGTAHVAGSTAHVPVTFENFGKKEQLTYTLALVDGSWKIADIAYGNELGTLTEIFEANSPRTPPA